VRRLRDDFSASTKRRIERLAGHACSICSVITTGSNAEGSGLITIGAAAHICAAAEGGPRYDPAMTVEQRSSASNGIWLCRNHGDLIDDDPAYFTVQRLRDLKRKAERASWQQVLRAAPDTRQGASADVPLREAAIADLAVFRNMDRWPKSAVALTLKVDDLPESVTTFGLATAAQSLDDLVLVAAPGMGKTTTLLQIAEGVLATALGVPIFVSLADWAVDGRSILASILGRAAWLDHSEGDLRHSAGAGNIVLLLDGWNELDASFREKARVELERLKAELPALSLVISTRRQSLDVPFGGTRVELLPLSEAQQLAVAKALCSDEGAERLDRAWRTPHVRDLVSIPLYLSALMKLPTGSPFPETREELLRRFVEAQEAQPRARTKLQEGALRFHRTFLENLALAGMELASPAISDFDARRSVTRAARDLIDDSQIVTPPDPNDVLEALVANHVLVRAADGSGIAFQHQQFQEWFASRGVERRMWAATLKGSAYKALQRDILDNPVWEEAILFAVERLARGSPQDQRVATQTILAAFDVDPLLAADMIRRANDSVWAPVAQAIFNRIARWHKRGTSDRALRFMIESGRNEFIDYIWPLIIDDNEQVSLKAIRNCRRFPTSVLGADAAERISRLPPKPREVLLHELAMHGGVDGLDLAVAVARSDPEVDVQVSVADALEFRLADRHLAILLGDGPDSLFDRIRWGKRQPDLDDPRLIERFNAARARRRSAPRTPIQRLREIIYDEPGPKSPGEIENLILALDLSKPSADEDGSRVIHQLYQSHPTEVAAGLLARLSADLPLIFGADDILAKAGLAVDDDRMITRAMRPGDHDELGEAAASVLGPIGASRLLDEVLPLWIGLRGRRKSYDRALGERYNSICSRIAHIPAVSLVAMAEARSQQADTPLIVLLAKLLARNRDDDSERSRPFDSRSRVIVQRLAQSWGERLLQATDATRHDVSEVATLIAHVPDPSLLPILSRMLDDNLAQYGAIRAEAAATGWRQSPLRDEASWPVTGEYFRAFLAIDTPETRLLMRRYLAEPHFGEEAARVIKVQWVSANEPRVSGISSWRNQFAHVAARRSQRQADPSLTTEDAEAVFSVVETLIGSEASDEERSLGVRLAIEAVRLPHGERRDAIDRLLALAHPRSRADLVAGLVQSGEVVSTATVVDGISELFERAKTESWLLHDSSGWALREWLRLLPFTDDLAAAVEAIRAIPVEHRSRSQLDCVVSALAITPSPGAENALLALAEIEPRLYEDHGWYQAAQTLRSEAGARRLIDLAATETVKGTRSSMGGWQWARDLGSMLREFPSLRQYVYKRLRTAEPTPGHVRLAKGVAEALDEDGLLLLLDLEMKWTRSFLSFHAIRDLVTEHVPSAEWSNAYSIVPVAAGRLRKRLLALTTDGGAQDVHARALITIDIVRDEHGRPGGEPRHPDLASGRPWPIMAPDPDATAD